MACKYARLQIVYCHIWREISSILLTYLLRPFQLLCQHRVLSPLVRYIIIKIILCFSSLAFYTIWAIIIIIIITFNFFCFYTQGYQNNNNTKIYRMHAKRQRTAESEAQPRVFNPRFYTGYPITMQKAQPVVKV